MTLCIRNLSSAIDREHVGITGRRVQVGIKREHMGYIIRLCLQHLVAVGLAIWTPRWEERKLWWYKKVALIVTVTWDKS